jgi:hypothetical protein
MTTDRMRLAIENARRVKERLQDALAGLDFVAPETTREKAAAIVAAGNFAGRGRKREEMLENHVHEWRLDMRYVDPAYRDRAMRDPDDEFLGWLKERVSKPLWLSAEATNWAMKRYPDQPIQSLVRIWHAELGWAFRQRGSEDVRTAVMAGIWYRQAMLDTSRYFKAVMAAHLDRVIEEGGYLGSEGREMTYADVMAAERLPDFQPLWRALARKEFPLVESASEEKLAEQRVVVAAEYRGQLDRERSQRIAVLFAKVRPGRMPSAMKAALAAGWDAQMLVEAEREFFALLLERKIDILEPAGFGDREFTAWIAANAARRRRSRRSRESDLDRRAAFFRGEPGGAGLELRNSRAVKWMPEEFEIFGHDRTEVLEGWKRAVWNGEVPCPETESERQNAFRAMLDALAKANIPRDQVMGMAKEVEFVDHPVVVHYGWYLVKQANDRRRAILGEQASLID